MPGGRLVGMPPLTQFKFLMKTSRVIGLVCVCIDDKNTASRFSALHVPMTESVGDVPWSDLGLGLKTNVK